MTDQQPTPDQPDGKQGWKQVDLGELLRWQRLPGWARAAAFTFIGVILGSAVAGSPPPAESTPAVASAEVVTETATEVVTETVTETVTEKVTEEAKPDPKPKEEAPAATDEYRDLTNRQFAKIMRNPEAHVGERVLVFGEIFQFDQFTGEDAFLADVEGNQDPCTYGICEYYVNGATALLVANGADFGNLIEGDVFMAHGTVVGEYQYDTQIGGSTGAVEFTVEEIVPHKK